VRTRSPLKVEICVSDVVSAIASQVGGAHRVELCAELAVGGTTPSAGAIAVACRSLSIPVHVLVRPRAGDFIYSELELTVMRHDIETAKALGASGVVLGALTRDGTIDVEQTSSLIALARPLAVTYHKAFDQVREPFEALDTLISLGVDRILSSGGEATALLGVETLAALVERAAGRIVIMGGGRLDAVGVPRVIRQGKVSEVHLGSAVTGPAGRALAAIPGDESAACWLREMTGRVQEIVKLVRNLEQVEGISQ
jgi:copper homeostasis protein